MWGNAPQGGDESARGSQVAPGGKEQPVKKKKKEENGCEQRSFSGGPKEQFVPATLPIPSPCFLAGSFRVRQSFRVARARGVIRLRGRP